MVERPDRMWSTGEGNGKPLQYSCLEDPMNSMKRQEKKKKKKETSELQNSKYLTPVSILCINKGESGQS